MSLPHEDIIKQISMSLPHEDIIKQISVFLPHEDIIKQISVSLPQGLLDHFKLTLVLRIVYLKESIGYRV